jgi:hypothetical protein
MNKPAAKLTPLETAARWLCAAGLAVAGHAAAEPPAKPASAKPASAKPASAKAPAKAASATAKPPFEGPWEDFPRTYPQPRYEKDPGYKPNYQFGVTKAFPPYKDPDIREAENLPNPLLNPAFKSYNLIVVVNKAKDPFWGEPQTLRVYQRGKGLIYYWLISTGMKGFDTPSGYYTPQNFSSRHWSQSWDAPMLWAVFFNGGRALHSSLDRYSLHQLGRATDSHGCVHIEDYRAEELFHLVGKSGYGQVDQIDRNSGKPAGKIQSYKTLIIVSPTGRWNGEPGGSPRVAGKAPGTGTAKAPAEALTKRTDKGVRHTLKIPGDTGAPTPEKLF